MLKKILFAFLVMCFITVSAQTLIIDKDGDGGFNNGTDIVSNGWSHNQASATPTANQWVVNTGASSPSGRCAYITNNATATTPPNTYTINVGAATHFYRDITIPAGEPDITLSFIYKVAGENSFDRMRIWVVPTTFTPTYGNEITNTGTAPTGRVQVGGNYSDANIWTTVSNLKLPSAYAGTTVRLVFEWRNDATVGTNPPIAIDHINLVSDVNTSYCESTSNNPSYYINDFVTNAGVGQDISRLNSGFTYPGYANYTSDIVEQFSGGLVEFSADFSGTFYTYGFNIWVDWGGDLDFNDSDEKVYASGGYVTDVNSVFTIPPGTPPGDYTMRIRANYLNINPDPCGNIGSGETEDYTIRVLGSTCTDNPSNTIVSAIDITTATINWTAATPIPSQGYEYFITTNPNTPAYNQAPTGTTTNTTTTADLIDLTHSTQYYVWVRSICGPNFADAGAWIGPEPFTTLISPPIITDVNLVCPGDEDSSQELVTSANCISFTDIGTTINGNLDIAGPYARTPRWSIVNSTICDFGGTERFKSYDTFEFQVSTEGTYTFNSGPGTTAFDVLAYIVTGDFTYGTCDTGDWIAGDDDSGDTPWNSSRITTTLIPGITYTLVTTIALDSNLTAPYQWNITGPGTLLSPIAGNIEWYTTPTGGSPIATGNTFNPVGVTGSGLINTNTGGAYTYWAACSTTPNIRGQANFVIGKLWNGSSSTDWNNDDNWTPSGAPTYNDCVIIPDTGGNNPIIFNDAIENYISSLAIQNAAILTQNPESNLNIEYDLTIEAGGAYNMGNSASLIQQGYVDNNSINGTFTMDRTANIRRTDFVYWSSPVNNFNINELSPNTPNGNKYIWTPTMPQGAGPPPGNVPMVYGDWETYNSGPMAAAKGYAIRGPNGAPYNNLTTEDFTATFIGAPNNGNISYPLSSGYYNGGPIDYQATPGVTLTVTASDDNWNLIGNPYPSAIEAGYFLDLNPLIEGAVHIWTHGTALNDAAINGNSFYDSFAFTYSPNDYITFNQSGTNYPPNDNLFSGQIAAGQGFFVLALQDDETGNINFNNDMRYGPNDQFYRPTNSNNPAQTARNNHRERHRIWIDLISPSAQSSTILVGYIEGATMEKDRMFDATNLEVNTLNIYSKIEDQRMIIQGRSLPFNIDDQVGIGLFVPESGTYTIAIKALDGLFEDESQDVYLEDTYTNIIHNLRAAPYNFSSEIGNFDDRFILRYNNTTLSVKDVELLNGVRVFEEYEKLVVKSESGIIQSIEVYDVLGRNLYENSAVKTDRFIINALNPSTSTLVLKIKLKDGRQKIAKIIF